MLSQEEKKKIEEMFPEIKKENRKEAFDKIDDFFCKEGMTLPTIILGLSDFVTGALCSNYVDVLKEEIQDEDKINEALEQSNNSINDITNKLYAALHESISEDENITAMNLLTALCYTLQSTLMNTLYVTKKAEEESLKEE